MKNVQTSLNEAEYGRLKRECERLRESQYKFVKKAIQERMAKMDSVLAKADRWILEGH